MPNSIQRLLHQRPPWPVLLVVAMTAAAAILQFPYYRVPESFAPYFPWLYFSFITLLCFGIYIGSRVAFVFDVITVWIFPLETVMGIKPPLRGTLLSLSHIVAVVLLCICWRYFWQKRGESPAT